MSFTQNSPGAVCILSATGVLSKVSLKDLGTSGVVTYEGLFEILTLSGSFLPSEIGNPPSTTGEFAVSLAGADGQIFGGVANGLIAASPVQVTVGTFTPPATMLNPDLGGTRGANSPPSRGTDIGLSRWLASHPKSKRSKTYEV